MADEQKLVRGERRCMSGVNEYGNTFTQYVRADWADAEIERLRMQLAGCGVGAQCNTAETIAKQRIGPDSPYYCASIADVYRAVDREMALRDVLDRMIKAWEGRGENMDRLCEIARGLT